ncbi:MAG: IS110 family transposase [Thermodesulfovibrionales bacterium]|jgi:transposase
MNLYCGVDLHGDNGYYGIVDEDNRRIFRKRLPNKLDTVLRELEPYRKQLKGIAIESTYNWYWLVDGLMENDHKVGLANPAVMEQYSGLKNSNDETDAFFIADQMRLGLLKYGHIYPKEERPVRDILRRRMLFVQQKTAQILSFESLFSRQTGGKINGSQVQQLSGKDIEDFFPDEHVRLMAQSSIETIRFLTERISLFEKTALRQCRPKEEFKKLFTVPGVGDVLTLTIMLETGDINRFAHVGNYTSYCRGVKADKYSNEKKKGKNNRKNGNKYLAWAYVEAAHYMIRYCPEAKKWYQRKLARSGKVVALKALASKISKACYFIIKDQVDFDMKKIFG